MVGCARPTSQIAREEKTPVLRTAQDPLFQKALGGDPEAQYQVGRIYCEGKGFQYDGKGIPRDYPKAIEYLTKSAQQGHAQAQNDLALMYLHGQGVIEDHQEAAMWLTLAAEQNLPEAQYHLSRLYAQGKGVSKDEEIAFDLLSKSAQANYVKAQYHLGLYYIWGRNFLFRPKGFIDSKDLFDFKYLFEMTEIIHTLHEKTLPNMNKQDIELGFSWLEKAKGQGSQEAAKAFQQLSIFRFIDFKTGKLDVNAFLSAQTDEQNEALLKENIGEIFK